MANWNGLILTDLGRALQAKVEAGQTLLILTKFKLGNGVISGGQALERLTDLVSPKQIIGINTCVPSENGLCTITGVVVNTGLTTGYELKELGVFATDPDLGEILYAITIDNHPDYLQAEGGATVVSEEFNLNIAISNTSNVTAVIDTAGLATIGNINTLISEHNTSETAHEDIRTAIADATKKAGLPVGHEYTIPYTELQTGQLALLGGKYLKSTYTDLWAWVQTHPSLIKTETQWQVAYTASGGKAVPFYANVDDTHFRVPLVTTWVRGASSVDEVGAVLEAGLPNITGEAGEYAVASVISSGALKTALLKNGVAGTGTTQGIAKATFDASLSNPIYGKSTTVQPQSIVRLWVVQAFGTTSNVGNIDVSQVAQGVTDVTARVSTIENRGWFTQDLSQNGWCKMPNGLILQWVTGVVGTIDSTQVLTYPIAVSRVIHAEISSIYPSGNGGYDGEWQIYNIGTTSTSIYSQVYDTNCTNPSIPHLFIWGVI